MWTEAFDAMVAPARPSRAFWRLILGVLIVLGIYGAGMGAFVFVLSHMARPSQSTLTLLLLYSFLAMLAGPLIAARLIHRRSWRGLFGAGAMRDFGLATGICAAALGASALLPMGFEPIAHIDTRIWLMLLPLAVIGLLLQTGAEEVLFRGYLQSQLAARFFSPVIWAVIPSLLFGLAHYAPAEMGLNAWPMVLATGLFGLCAADLTAQRGNIGAAWGFHFVNNFAAMLLVAMPGPLGGIALYHTPFGPADQTLLPALLWLDMGVTVITWAVLRFGMARLAPLHR